MKKILFLILVAATLYSQESGSPYTRFGLGFFNYSGSARVLGNAGTTIASYDDNELNNLNPAGWSRIKNTIFSSGLIMESSTSEDSKSTKNFKNINFTNTILGIPLEKDEEIVFTLGIFSKSKVGYNVSRSVTVGEEPAKEIFFGSGGLSEFITGLSYSPLKDLNIGVKVGYDFGEVQHAGKMQFDNEDYTNSEFTNSMYIKGFSFTGGIIYSGLGKYLKLPSASVGLIFTPKSSLTSTRERYSYFTSGSNKLYDTLVNSDVDITLPSMFGIGVNLGLNDRLNLGLDYTTNGWENYKFDGSNEGLQNSQRFSVSCELMPDKDFLAQFTARMRYSLGLYYEKMNLKINGENINEYGVTAGVGLPLARGAFLNTALVYGRRGKNENGLVLDSFFKLYLSLSLNELWFVNTEDQ